MGTWGTAIFSDDLAADIRGDWRDAITGGLSPEAATRKLIEQYNDSINDADEGPRFWFALAASQAATGRLQHEVRDKALAIIGAGGDVALFAAEDPKLGRKREEVLRQLATTLRGPQKPPNRLAQPRPQVTPLAIGDVVRIRGEQGSRQCFFVVLAHAKGWPPGSTWPVLGGLLWTGTGEPSPDELGRLPFLRDNPIVHADQGPVVDLHVVSGPTRGPRSFDKFASVIASGVRRPDAPDYESAGATGRGARVGYTSWQTLSMWVDGDVWLPRVTKLTEAVLAAPISDGVKPSRRWPWSRPRS